MTYLAVTCYLFLLSLLSTKQRKLAVCLLKMCEFKDQKLKLGQKCTHLFFVSPASVTLFYTFRHQ